MHLFDTNSIIYSFKGDQKMIDFFGLVKNANEEFNISVITKIELLCYKENGEIKRIKELLNNCNIFSLDDKVVEQTIKIRKKYKLKLPDAIIGATALVNNLILVTHNKKDFEKIRSLKIIDPLH